MSEALVANNKVYKISASAPDTQWPELGPKLKTCVDSFDLSTDPAPGKTAFPHQGFRIRALDGAATEDKLQILFNDERCPGHHSAVYQDAQGLRGRVQAKVNENAQE